MGNAAPTKAMESNRNFARRLEAFKESPEWRYIVDHLVDPLNATISTHSSQLATLVMLSAGRRGLWDYAALYGDMPSDTVIKALLQGHESLILSSDAAQELFGTGLASMADFMAVALDHSQLDGAVEKKLGAIFVQGPVESSPETMQAALRDPYATKLLQYPSVADGLQELTAFHRKHLKGRVLNPAWSWADTAHVVLIIMTSLQWEQRLYREFGKDITQSALVSIATEQLHWLNERNEFAHHRNTSLRLAILRALDISLVAAS